MQSKIFYLSEVPLVCQFHSREVFAIKLADKPQLLCPICPESCQDIKLVTAEELLNKRIQDIQNIKGLQVP